MFDYEEILYDALLDNDDSIQSAAPGAPKIANGEGSSHSDDDARNQGTSHAFSKTPANEPCSVYC